MAIARQEMSASMHILEKGRKSVLITKGVSVNWVNGGPRFWHASQMLTKDDCRSDVPS